jgi:NTP pyrophosphatase (non-canonical NTP hydrolase)
MNRVEYINVCLMEEPSELTKEASKVLRFGAFDVSPANDKSHIDKLEDEFHDVLAVYQMLLSEYGKDFVINEDKLRRKKEKVENMYKLSKKLGTVD